jgi:hypothetical protein
MLRAAAFIEPCLPSPADKPPSGSNWIHEIKHDGFRLMARRDPVGIRLLTRRGNDWGARFPLVVEAVNHLKVRCLIDGEVVCCDEKGVTSFQLLRHRRNEPEDLQRSGGKTRNKRSYARCRSPAERVYSLVVLSRKNLSAEDKTESRRLNGPRMAIVEIRPLSF